jgi:galactokinase
LSKTSAFAPGRVNLIGEHTDYNGGLALPFAVAQGITVKVSVSGGPGAAPPPLVAAAIATLRERTLPLPEHLAVTITSDLPQGAGLSSSAALTVATVLALHALAGASLPSPLAVAQMCQRIEQQATGARTGLLDQLASLLGRRGEATLIDFGASAPTMHQIPVNLHVGLGGRFVVVDSGERRQLAASGYNQRRAECEQAARLLGVPNLSDATEDDLRRLRDSTLRSRARHVITENARTRAMVAALRGGSHTNVLGQLLNESHASLRDDYEVSTTAVERTVSQLINAGAAGARIMGGGFGGSVLALMPADAPTPLGAVDVMPADGARALREEAW